MSNYLEDLAQSVIVGQEDRVKQLTQQAIDSGADPVEIINQGLIPGMNVVGARFKVGQMFVPEVLMSARAMNGGMELVKPLLLDEELPTAGKVVLGTVKGDLHDIGKNLVGMMLESAGFTVVNLGVDAGPDKFLQAIKEHKPGIIGLSALLTTTMLSMKDTIEVLKEEGLRDKVKVIIGGAPISQDFADEIGADGFAPDAASATDLCKKLLA
ncbi:Methyltransferase cognate corrinoid protein [Acididesulfobacillus acetoxydans]|uniref:Dimethylamine corrinoid protein 1 n=1 Tax=Acididesulfobacillus acetoxydans TaxID=1561005 RepID=A0A8S0WWY6_9FIRM|nr:corrinoid protein [Acididesulfobacillus acetoxydans]CAA7600601.1 Methyltransferase cognate corrinoid protein [Acididesulfobacillus acetoxydans]CEJ09382.1 Dimethylamine corrinoid protein 1 [Acididesulfobacillus acetoxydans]